MGHFAVACRSSKVVETIQEGLLSDDSESILLRTISSIEQEYVCIQAWISIIKTANLKLLLEQQSLQFQKVYN